MAKPGHDIDRQLAENPVSVNAMKVVRRLKSDGFDAYLVGGCIRDLLIGRSPKDFDVATDAHPEDIRELFRNSRSIGKRFKIVHVRFGRDIVEVTTFRAPHNETSEASPSGMLLSDNIYGTFEEDVIRRDFTMNALYYDPEAGEIVDQVNGLEDVDNKLIRLIGDPESRYREDPVRMLRAARFQAKLGFEIEKSTRQPIKKLGFLLQDVPPARLFEETLKLFMSGHGEASLEAIRELEIFQWMFPDSAEAANKKLALEIMHLALRSTDQRVKNDQPVTPAFIYAALLWQPFLTERGKLINDGKVFSIANNEAANNVIGKQQLFTSIPRRFSGPVRDIWFLQFRLQKRGGKKAESLLLHKRFRAAYDFLLIREAAGEDLEGLGEWWTKFQDENPEQRQQMLKPKRTNRRRRRTPRKKTHSQ